MNSETELRSSPVPLDRDQAGLLLALLDDPLVEVRSGAFLALLRAPMTERLRADLERYLVASLRAMAAEPTSHETPLLKSSVAIAAAKFFPSDEVEESLLSIEQDWKPPTSGGRPLETSLRADPEARHHDPDPAPLDTHIGSETGERAAALADELLDRLADGLPDLSNDDIDALRFLDREYAAVLITAFFLRLLSLPKAEMRDAWYMNGNEVVKLVYELGPAFAPDIAALFEIYLGVHDDLAPARDEWYRTRDDTIAYFEKTHLAGSWQLAWTVARASPAKIIFDLAPWLASGTPHEKLAAVQLIEDAFRYSIMTHPPLFGGVTAPPDDERLMILAADDTMETKPYDVVDVYYGTNRSIDDKTRPATFYGRRRDMGKLHLGMCKVSIPKSHVEGRLERPTFWKLEFSEDPSRHVALLGVTEQSAGEFSDRLKQAFDNSSDRQAILFVHGYRVTFEDAARRTAQLALDLDIGIPLLFSWPSRNTFLGYATDADSAGDASDELLQFLKIIATQAATNTIHLIAHSMGNLTLTTALKEFAGKVSATFDDTVFKEVVLTAPDIDAGIFREKALPKIREILGKAGRITLYASRWDKALKTAKFLKSGYPRAGDASNNEIFIAESVDTVDASAVDTSFLGHSYYGSSSSVVADLRDLLKLGKNPGERSGMQATTYSATRPASQYWILHPQKLST